MPASGIPLPFRLLRNLFGWLLLLSATANAAPLASPDWFPWGNVQIKEKSVELHVTSIPLGREVPLPRLNTPYERLYLRAQPELELGFRPEVDEWFVRLPTGVGDSPVVVMETVGRPERHEAPVAIKPGVDGTYVLPAHQARVHGEKLRYEPQPHKNTIGYWTVKDDWCEWKVSVPESALGRYAVHVLQGCGKDQGGSEVELRLGAGRLRFTVEDTGHFQNFKDRKVGTVLIERAGEQLFQVRAATKAGVAVMDVRRIRLVRVP